MMSRDERRFIAGLLSYIDDLEEQLDQAGEHTTRLELEIDRLQLEADGLREKTTQIGKRREAFREPRCEDQPGDYRCRLLPGHEGQHLY
jgi:FtsZ-binding cell division protein ZapB